MSSSPAADPSTEQILADIRRSIADIAGQSRARAAAPTRPAGAPPETRPGATQAGPAPAASPSDSVVALRPRQAEPDRVAAPAQPEQARAEPASPPAAEPGETPEPHYSYTLKREAQPPQPETPIMSAETDASVSRAFTGLASTLLSNEARTLEDLVREMLRPMLKTWLDSNLPPLVERLVREEIERVARSQRSP